MRRTFKSILADYGPIALGVYLAIFAVVLLGSWVAIRIGWTPESAAGSVGTFTAAYLLTKLTQPLRIGATLVLTPIVARAADRFFPGRRGAPPTTPPDAAAEPAVPAPNRPER